MIFVDKAWNRLEISSNWLNGKIIKNCILGFLNYETQIYLTHEIDEEDPLIKAIKAARDKNERKIPHDINSDDFITDLSFHPAKNLFTYATIHGHLFLYEYDYENNILKTKSRIHKGSIRSLEFNQSGQYVVTGGEDKSFQVIDTVRT